MAYWTRPSLVVGSSFGRSTNVILPHAWDPRKIYPLLVILHSYGATGADAIGRFVLTEAQDFDDGCIIFAPNATNDFAGTKYWDYWTIPHAGDDFDFINATVAEIKSKFSIGPVLGIGYSNGGFLTIQLSLQYPSLYNSIATHSCGGGLNDSVLPAAYTIPRMHFHGTLDPTVLPAGDPAAATLPGPLAGHGGVGSTGYGSTLVTAAAANLRNSGLGVLGATYATIDYTTTGTPTGTGAETTQRAYSLTTSQTAVENWDGTDVQHTINLSANKGQVLYTWLQANRRT